MSKFLQKIRQAEWPFYPVLIFAYPFLHLWAENLARRINPTKFIYPFGLSLGIFLVLWVLLGFLYRSVSRGAIAVSLMVFVFFSYGHLHRLWLVNTDIHPRIYSAVFILVFLLSGSIFFFKPLLQKKIPRILTSYLNVAASILVLIPLMEIGIDTYHSAHEPNVSIEFTEAVPSPTKLPKTLPDVYYIIVDEYGRKDIVEQVFRYDNQPFLDFLQKKGFYVAHQSASNYAVTLYSLASSLNMRYLKESQPWGVLIDEIEWNLAGRFFKRLGYRYVFVSSPCAFTEFSRLADQIIGYNGVDEVQLMLANSTLLKPFSALTLGADWRNRHLYNFRALEKLPEQEGPQFVFAHLLLPHTPLVFKKDGSLLGGITIRFDPRPHSERYMNNYAGQLHYTNVLLERLINQILAKSKTPPVIIIHSDHGIDPLIEDWKTPEAIKKRFPNFTAVYLPDRNYEKFYPTLTPVNIFRLVLNHLFGTNLDKLEDKVYFDKAAVDSDGMITWKDVTSLVIGPESAGKPV